MKKLLYITVAMLVALAACKKPEGTPDPSKEPVENPSEDPSKNPDVSADPSGETVDPETSEDPSSSEDPGPKVKVTVETGEALDATLNRVRLTAEFEVENAPEGKMAECYISYGLYDSTPAAKDILDDYIEEMDLGSTNGFLGTEGEAEDLEPDTRYYYMAWVKLGEEIYTGQVKNFRTKAYGDYAEAVDLGLGVKWCNVNIGAMKPQEEGYFFAWGEILAKSTFTYATYTHVTHVDDPMDFGEFINYPETDNPKKLSLSDDAAYKLLGRGWRIPTVAELQELVSNCTWEYNDEDFYYTVTGPSGESIILPVAGWKDEDGWQGYGNKAGYWSSEYKGYEPQEACCLWLQPNYPTASVRVNATDSWMDRYQGLNIRAVARE